MHNFFEQAVLDVNRRNLLIQAAVGKSAESSLRSTLITKQMNIANNNWLLSTSAIRSLKVRQNVVLRPGMP